MTGNHLEVVIYSKAHTWCVWTCSEIYMSFMHDMAANINICKKKQTPNIHDVIFYK